MVMTKTTTVHYWKTIATRSYEIFIPSLSVNAYGLIP